MILWDEKLQQQQIFGEAGFAVTQWPIDPPLYTRYTQAVQIPVSSPYTHGTLAGVDNCDSCIHGVCMTNNKFQRPRLDVTPLRYTSLCRGSSPACRGNMMCPVLCCVQLVTATASLLFALQIHTWQLGLGSHLLHWTSPSRFFFLFFTFCPCSETHFTNKYFEKFILKIDSFQGANKDRHRGPTWQC